MRLLATIFTMILTASIIGQSPVRSHWIQRFNILRWGRNRGRHRNANPISLQKRNHSNDESTTFKALGLQNLGNTCYMNSVLQGLFYCESFKQYIRTYTPSSKQKQGSFGLLQDLYKYLSSGDGRNHESNGEASPRALVQCLGLNPSVQEDAQEFYLKLINKLNDDESAELSSNKVLDLFTGKFENYISCRDVEFTKSKTQKFRDLSLDVTASLHASMKKLLEPSILDGENMYKTDQFGRQVAAKGCKIIQLPKLLVIQVNRFTYDLNLGRRLKLPDRFEFPVTLQMAPFFNTTSLSGDSSNVESTDPNMSYELKSVIIHTGTPEFGHYIALARPQPASNPDSWIKLDDNRVTEISYQQMCEIAFGGTAYMLPGVPDHASTNAYMLLYEKK